MTHGTLNGVTDYLYLLNERKAETGTLKQRAAAVRELTAFLQHLLAGEGATYKLLALQKVLFPYHLYTGSALAAWEGALEKSLGLLDREVEARVSAVLLPAEDELAYLRALQAHEAFLLEKVSDALGPTFPDGDGGESADFPDDGDRTDFGERWEEFPVPHNVRPE